MITCVICKMGKLEAGKARMTLERNGAAIVIENIPALVCPVCQEEYFDENITGQVLEFAEKVFETGVQTPVVTFDMQDSLVTS